MEAGSGNSGTFSPETAESLRFEEEIQSLMQLHANFDSSPVSGSSFTALLGLSPPPEISAGTLALPLVDCAPVFPSNAALVERAARFSAFAAAAEVKAEAEDYGDPPSIERRQRLTGKRKAAEEKSKVKGPVKKKSKNAEENTGGEKLPYVHVRARRGQATDSHSLAERARREKINARMKLLQELVPGCSKISGTALVLDETINHVQSLQRHVEFLSMKLAAVYPGVNFNGLGLDSFSTECGHLMAGSGRMEQLPWLDGMVNGMKLQQQIWVMDHHQEEQKQHKQQEWERDDTQQCHVFISNPSSTTSNFCYDSSTPNAVELHNQLKTEL